MENLYDVIIIGGGPAGLTAGLYLARAKYRCLIVEKESLGGQISITDEVVNYPGIARISGKALMETMASQAKNFGGEFLTAEATGLELSADVKTLHTSKGDYHAFGILLATGAHPRSVGFQGELEFQGKGVAYCATCDGEFFAGKEIFVVGGGYAAAEESVFLTKYARHVTILIRKEDFSCAASVADAARNHPKITVRTQVQVEQVMGDTALRGIRWRNTQTSETEEYHAPAGDFIGVFVFAGYEPATSLVADMLTLDKGGYIPTDDTLKTEIDGLYAAGDVRVKQLRQVITAAGDGALAATELERYAAAMHKKTGLTPQQPNGNTPSSFDESTDAQLRNLFSRMDGNLILQLFLDDSDTAHQLQSQMEQLAAMTDKLTVKTAGSGTPCVKVCRDDGSFTGLSFHGVPGGHEFSSFLLGLYNAAGPGQNVTEIQKNAIAQLPPTRLQILVTLSCSMCPELVTAAQLIAARNPQVTAEVYDLRHFPELREQYHVMSVPCLVVDEGKAVSFGKKSLDQLLDFLTDSAT